MESEKAMTTTQSCESCGMPIESGRYCGYCTDESGALQSFDERFERMTAWQSRRDPTASRAEIERQTLDYMATMPAWRTHPRVAKRSLTPTTLHRPTVARGERSELRVARLRRSRRGLPAG
jgi:hypothetical protein